MGSGKFGHVEQCESRSSRSRPASNTLVTIFLAMLNRAYKVGQGQQTIQLLQR